MDLSGAFKHTEFGVIPEDWSLSTVGAEFSVELGKMLDSEKNVGVLKPFLGNRAVQWGRIDLADVGTIKLTPSDMQRFRLREGDLLVCEGGEIGRAAIWTAPISECYYQKALHRLRAKRGYSATLMQNVLQYLAATKRLDGYATQTSIAHLPKDKFETVPIPVPSTDAEQKAIAEALTDADALIESLEQLLAKKRQAKQGAMQELLTGKRRLAGFTRRWVERGLGSLAMIQRGASPRPIDDPVWFDESSSIGWVRISDLSSSGMFLRETEQRLSPLGVRHSRPVPAGSLIMSICATVGRPIITAIDTCIHDGFVVFNGLRAEKHFLYYYLCFIQPEWSKHGQTGSQMNLNTGLISRTDVVIPRDVAEQEAISKVIMAIDGDIEAVEHRLAKARRIKTAMMQALLTGRIRLVDAKPAEDLELVHSA